MANRSNGADQVNGGCALGAQRGRPAAALFLFVAAAALLASAGCKKDEPDASVDTSCPGGRRAATTLSLALRPAGPRPDDEPKQIRVRGYRAATDACYAEGAGVVFSSDLKEPARLNVALPPLADGQWVFTVTELPEEENKPIEINQTLQAGQRVTLTVSAGPGRELAASFEGM